MDRIELYNEELKRLHSSFQKALDYDRERNLIYFGDKMSPSDQCSRMIQSVLLDLQNQKEQENKINLLEKKVWQLTTKIDSLLKKF